MGWTVSESSLGMCAQPRHEFYHISLDAIPSSHSARSSPQPPEQITRRANHIRERRKGDQASPGLVTMQVTRHAMMCVWMDARAGKTREFRLLLVPSTRRRRRTDTPARRKMLAIGRLVLLTPSFSPRRSLTHAQQDMSQPQTSRAVLLHPAPRADDSRKPLHGRKNRRPRFVRLVSPGKRRVSSCSHGRQLFSPLDYGILRICKEKKKEGMIAESSESARKKTRRV